MQKVFILSILSLLPYLSSQAALPPVSTEEAKQSPTFTETDKGYSITFPNQWHWQRDFMGLDVFSPAPIKDEQSGSLGNISVVSGKLDNVDLETFYNTNVDNLKKALRDVKVIETGKAFVDGTEARKIVYSHSMGEMKLRVLQYFVLKNGTGYIITCTSSEEEFPKYADSFEASVRSFKLQ